MSNKFKDFKNMGNNIYRHWSYIKPGEFPHYWCNKNGFNTGEAVGVIIVSAWLPCPPGHVSNSNSYNFPIRYVELPDSSQQKVHGADQGLVPALIETAKQLEEDGCRVICADCGYFGHFQKQVADEVDVPVYLSGVIQVPWIRVGLKSSQKIGIICGDEHSLTYSLFESCGVSKEDYDRCVIVGAQDQPEFYKFDKNEGNFDAEVVKDEIVGLAVKLQKENPDLGAILLECTDMPPYSAAIQEATQLPVFDTTTMIKFLHNVVCQKPYGGWV